MKKDIEEFYFDMKLPVGAILQKLLGERISKPSIQAALEKIWKQFSERKCRRLPGIQRF